MRKILWIVVCFAVFQALFAAWKMDRTYDERNHLRFSHSLVADGRIDRSPASSFSQMPVSIPNALAENLAASTGLSEQGARFLSRLPSAFWLLGIYFFCFQAASLLTRSESAAALATLIVVCDPNLIAHSALATVDVAFAFSVIAFASTGVRYFQRPSLSSALWFGVAFGFSLLCKFSGILLVPVFMAALLSQGNNFSLGARPPQRICYLVLTLTLALVVVFAGNFFDQPTSFGATQWHSDLFRFLQLQAPSLIIPLPKAMLVGIDQALQVERQTPWNSVMFNEIHPEGSWFYFPVLWLVKTPIAVLVLEWAVLATGLLRISCWRRDISAAALLPAVTLLLFGFYFCLIFRTQVGYRYCLMCIPLFAILIAALADQYMHSALRKGALALMALCSMLEILPYTGDPLSFTNSAVYDKRMAYLVATDSNLDWGQNADKLQQNLAKFSTPPAVFPSQLVVGWNILEVNQYSGVTSEFSRFRWARENLRPFAQLNHSFLVIFLSGSDYERMMEESFAQGTSALAASRCRGEISDPLISSGLSSPSNPSPIRVTEADFPVPGKLFWNNTLDGRFRNFCLKTDSPLDLTVTAKRYFAHSGVVQENGSCLGVTLQSGKSDTMRFHPGFHLVCVGGNENAEISFTLKGDIPRLTEPGFPSARLPNL